MNELEHKIQYSFKDKTLLIKAMTHSSYINEHGLKKQDCNERLEFLGDAILELYSSRFLYENNPELMEGELSKKRASLVCEKSLANAARALRLGEILRLGKGMELSGGRSYDSILSDAFEALLAAIYLDGGEQKASELVHRFVLKETGSSEESDPKTALQELLQKHNRTPEYVLLSESGPEHEKKFEYEVRIDGIRYGKGSGRSKKAAQMEAASNTIRLIREETCI